VEALLSSVFDLRSSARAVGLVEVTDGLRWEDETPWDEEEIQVNGWLWKRNIKL